MNGDLVFGWVVGLLTGAFCAFILVAHSVVPITEETAVASGYAEFVFDKDTGKSEFVWLDLKVKR